MPTPDERAIERWLLLHEMFDEFPDAIVVCDEEARIRHVNNKAITTFGYGGEIDGRNIVQTEMLDQHVNILLDTDKAGPHSNYITEYMKNPQSRPMGLGLVIQGKRRSGLLFYCEISLQPLQRTAPKQRRILARIIPRDPPPHITLIAQAQEVEKALMGRIEELERKNEALVAELAQFRQA